MLAYILKSAITLALLYCLFFAFLSRETFHRFNRVCLLLIMILSLVLPLVHMTVSQPSAINEAIQSSEAYITEAPVPVLFEYGPIAAESEQSAAAEEVAAVPLTWETLLTYIYLIGVAVMVLFILFHTVQMIRLIRGGLRHTDGQGNTVILKPGIRSPFSLFHWIVMSVEDYEQHRDSILVHEQEHIRLHHTYDLLLLETVRVLQWFNPFIWFMGHDLKNIHEYEADEAVVNQGIDAKQYQQLLVLKAVGNRLQPFANNLRRGSLKQRFIMMYQKKSNRWMMLKALFILPAMGFALYAFATPSGGNTDIRNPRDTELRNHGTTELLDNDTVKVKDKLEKFEDQKVSVFQVVDSMPEFSGGNAAFLKYLRENIKYPESCKEQHIQGTVILQFVVCQDGSIAEPKVAKSVHPDLDKEALRVISGMPKWKPGSHRGKPVRVRYSIPVQFKLPDSTGNHDLALRESEEVISYWIRCPNPPGMALRVS